jgi:hypothetical protein
MTHSKQKAQEETSRSATIQRLGNSSLTGSDILEWNMTILRTTAIAATSFRQCSSGKIVEQNTTGGKTSLTLTYSALTDLMAIDQTCIKVTQLFCCAKEPTV